MQLPKEEINNMKKSELRQLIREAIKENDPFYKSDSYLDDPKPSVPDNITSVIDDMTITMGEEAFITAVFKALPLETAKSVLRIITKSNPIEHPSGPVDYDWLNENEGTYRVYMNSDPDEPERIDYERYFGDGTKAEMVQQAKEMAYSNDPTNMYGDPILVVVTHEDYIDDVAFTNVPVNEGPGQKHYTKDGKEWTGPTHKMPKGSLMTGDPHNDDSEELFHKADLKEVADPITLEIIGALSVIIGGSFGIKLGMDLLNKIVDKALAVTKYTATEILKIVKDNTAPLKAAAQEGKRAFVKKLMSLIINPTTTTSDYLDRIPKDPPFTIKRNEGTCGYNTDARTGKRFKTPGGL